MALAVLVVLVALPPAARVAASPLRDQADAVPRLALESQTAFVDPTGAFELVLRDPAAPPGAQLRVSLHPSVASIGRLRFEDTIGGRSLGTPLLSLPPIDVGAALAFGAGSVGVRLPVAPAAPAPEGGVVLPSAGVYPVSVQLTTAAGDPLDAFVTYLVRLPAPPADGGEGGPPLRFAAVVGMAAPPAYGADRTWQVDDAAIERLAETAAVLADTVGVDLSVAPLPETLAALAEVDGGETVLDPLRRATVGREVLGATWVPVDTGAWAAADLGEALRAEADTGTAAVGAVLGEVPALRTTLVDRTVDPAGLALLSGLGVDRAIVPDELLSPVTTDRQLTLTQPFELRDATGAPVLAMSAERGLSARIDATDDPVLAAHLVLADLSVLRLDLEGVERGAVLLVPDDVDPLFLQALLDGLAEPHPTALVGATTLGDLFDRVPVATVGDVGPGSDPTPLVRTWRSDPPADVSGYAAERTGTEQGLLGYRSLLGPDSDRWVPLERLVQSSGDRRHAPAVALEQLLTVQGLIGGDIAEIAIPPEQTITLTAEEGTLPVLVDNGLDVPVEVEIRLRSDRLEFPDGERVRAVLRPGSNRVEVTVRSRASGAFPIGVSLHSPDDRLELGEERVTVRSTAISGVGLVLSIGAGLFLALWWIRNFRSTRRARRLVSPTHPTARDAGDPAP